MSDELRCFKFNCIVARRNGKFYIIVKSENNKGSGYKLKDILEDNNKNLITLKMSLLRRLSSYYESDFLKPILHNEDRDFLTEEESALYKIFTATFNE